jgi:hypothetical protein
MRSAESYASSLATRLDKIAEAGSTGVLPFAGDCDGALYFQDGEIIYAESARTPGPAGGPPVPLPGVASAVAPSAARSAPSGRAAQRASSAARTAGRGRPAELAGPAAVLAALLAAGEPTVDAALQLWTSQAQPGRFRSGRPSGAAPVFSLTVPSLLAEIARREELLSQLAATVTCDTSVMRNPQLTAPRVRVTGPQWALLIRVGHASTPRDLAWACQRSVFSTTIEVYRLLALRVLLPAALAQEEDPPVSRGPAAAARRPAGVSLIQAAVQEKGTDVTLHPVPATLSPAGGR